MIRYYFLIGAVIAACVGIFFFPAIAQDPNYHWFADQRSWLGIPNAGNVLSNLPFVAVGLLGIARLLRSPTADRLQTAYWLFFIGVALTAFGSAFYHWSPNNNTLVWDRLPMTVTFMAFFSIIMAERISEQVGIRLLAPLIAIGIGSVVYWHWSETRGQGDLRPYVLVQFLPLVIIPFLLLAFTARANTAVYIWWAIGFYLLAKLFEVFDREIYRWLQLLSGHSIKHLCAASGAFCIYLAVSSKLKKITTDT